MKKLLAVLLSLAALVATMTACSSPSRTQGEDGTKNDPSTTITKDEAIQLVKAEMGEAYSFFPADELEEVNGKEYYVIHVKTLLPQGNYTSLATYYVRTDGAEVFDPNASGGKNDRDDSDPASYVGEYVRSGETGDVTFTVSKDGTFEMTTDGAVQQTVTGIYNFGITDRAETILLFVHPQKSVVDGKETDVDTAGAAGTAVIENGTLTLEMQSEKTVFTKK